MLRGGPAAKLGNRYETWCATAELVRLLHGETDTLRIEVPGIDKAEFVVGTGTRREAHQVKRSHPNGKWSFAALRADGLIGYIGKYLADDNSRFVFTSGSEARELLELVQAAKEAESIEEFTNRFVGETSRRDRFRTLVFDWDCAPHTAVDRLRRIELRTVDEPGLQEKVRWASLALFVADPENVLAELRAVVDDSVHRTITREYLVEELARKGYRIRHVINPQDTVFLVEEATNRYLHDARRRLIQHVLVPRSASATLLPRLNATASDSVLTGKAGSGKTASVVEVAEGLRARGQPVLAFRLDRIPSSVQTTTDLGRHLGLEESPTLVLAAAAEATERPGVLIVDQLDAVSSMSGRISTAFDLVERLIEEARGTWARTTIHTVVVCRSFDWKNDSRLRRLLPKDHDQIDVTEFQRDEVETILKREGFDQALFQPRQLELLQLPQNLSLFLEAGFDSSSEPDFNTATRLFEYYWNKKRDTVGTGVTDQWMPVIEMMCDEINTTQQLSVPQERLDHIRPEYLRSLTSEGVLSFDGRHYGFGHESFFDYCFARVFMNRSESIASFLKASEQHLFRRAQVRQVLVYLREADPRRYLQELEGLLSDQRIRAHIKDLAFALLSEVTDPSVGERAIWDQWSAAALQGIERGVQSTNKLSVLAWRRFFGSTSWFSDADRRGLIERWLASGNDRVVDMATNYLWGHHAHAPDRLASLLEPYADSGGEWVNRFRSLMERTEHHTSRAYFKLLLRLVDNGTLDDVRERTWFVVYSLGDNRPVWIPEFAAHRLRRRLAVIHAAGKDLRKRELIGYDDTAVRLLESAAKHAPLKYVQQLLPLVLDISDSTQVSHEPPTRDAVWWNIVKTEHPRGEDACLLGLSEALNELARNDNEAVPDIVSELRRRETYVANFLLHSVYRGAAKRFADEAVSLLSDQPWRFQCGYSDSPHWSTMELIRAVIPHCTRQNRERLETTIVNYVGPFERPTAKLRRDRIKYNGIGHTSFSLLSVIPMEIRGTRAQRYFCELERRFRKPDGPPLGIVGGFVPSPIAEPSAAMMTDAQWRRAIMKHRQGAPAVSLFTGGAHELAQVLGKLTKDDPHRFAHLSLTFPADANPVYLEGILHELRDAEVETDLKLQVCRKAFADSRGSCGKSIANVLGSVEEPLPPDAVEMLHWLATEHVDPQKELWQESVVPGRTYDNDGIYGYGINTARGRAAEAIQRLILTDASYIKRLGPTIERMIGDPSPAVRSCVVGVLRAVAYHDSAVGMSLFRCMNLSEEGLLATVHVYELIRSHLGDRFPNLHPFVERMLRSEKPKVCEFGARLASLAALVHESAEDLGEEAFHGTPCQRLGAAHVAAANVSVPRFRDWCEARLVTLFNDDDDSVRRETTMCFSRLPDETLETYGDLVRAFCDSRAFARGAFWLIQALEKSRGRLPGMTCMVCERSLDHPSAESFATAKLIFRTYQQHQHDEWASYTLNLIDRLCLEGDASLGSEFEEFDR